MKKILIITLLLFGYIVAQQEQAWVIEDSSSVIGKELIMLQSLYTKMLQDRATLDINIAQVEFAYRRFNMAQYADTTAVVKEEEENKEK